MSGRARIHDTLERLERWLREHQPAFLDAMRPGATDAELDDLERAIGRKLPDDVRAFYQWRNGIDYPDSWPEGMVNSFWDLPLPLELVKRDYTWARLDGQSPDRPSWWPPSWVPLFSDYNSDYISVDTDGVWTGVRGQIVHHCHDDDERSVCAASLTAWLRVLVRELERGRPFGEGVDHENPSNDAHIFYPFGYPRGFSWFDSPTVPEPTAAEPPISPERPDPNAFHIGERIRITSGAFAGMEGEIKLLIPGVWEIITTLTFWGRAIDIGLQPSHVELIGSATHSLPRIVWAACENGRELLGNLGFSPSDRKLRLLVLAGCRGWMDQQSAASPPLFDALQEVLEGTTDTARFDESLDDFWAEAYLSDATESSRDDLRQGLLRLRRYVIGAGRDFSELPSSVWHPHADLVREIFPNPFAPPRFDPAWRTSDVLALARSIYDGRAFEGLPVLADALQEAGCDNDELLNHLRDTSRTHVRGCWALDLCLGLE